MNNFNELEKMIRRQARLMAKERESLIRKKLNLFRDELSGFCCPDCCGRSLKLGIHREGGNSLLALRGCCAAGREAAYQRLQRRWPVD